MIYERIENPMWWRSPTGGRTGEGKVSRQHLEIISDDSIELVIQPNLADFRFIRF